jgi:hypothetical protein
MPEKPTKPLLYDYANLQRRIITPVCLYGISATSPKDTVTNALWDTGATLSAITPWIQQSLGLVPIGKQLVYGVTGAEKVDLVIITIELPNNVLKRNVKVAVCNFSNDVGMIIGMNIITLGDFALLHGRNHTVFSFAIPPKPT